MSMCSECRAASRVGGRRVCSLVVHLTLACSYSLVEVFNCLGTRASVKFRSSAKALGYRCRPLSTYLTLNLVPRLGAFLVFPALRLRVPR